MSDMFDKLMFYFTFPFVRYALIVGILIAFCSSLLGVTLVLKRYSFIGDGLSHVAFGAMAIASVLKLTNNMLLIMPITIITAVVILLAGPNAKIKGDAAIAMISVGALAIGYLIINVFSKSANISGDVCSTLFGSTSILTLTSTDVWICMVMSMIVIVVFCMFYNKIFAVTFDEDFARATGTKAKLYNLIIAVITAIIIVLAMNLVGSLLISALVIFPALSAMRVLKSFKGVVICSATISVVCAVIGIITAILASTPVGSTIVVVDIVVFALFCLLEIIMKKSKKIFASVMVILILCMITGCGNNSKKSYSLDNTGNADVEVETKEDSSEDNEDNNPDNTVDKDNETDKSNDTESEYDLTQMGSDMIYAMVFQMMSEPDDYEGCHIKMAGLYSPVYYEPTNQYYHYVIIEDALACCAQGIEFVWEDGSHVYPDEYPEENQKIVVEGTFETYKEEGDNTLYCHLANATLTIEE